MVRAEDNGADSTHIPQTTTTASASADQRPSGDAMVDVDVSQPSNVPDAPHLSSESEAAAAVVVVVNDEICPKATTANEGSNPGSDDAAPGKVQQLNKDFGALLVSGATDGEAKNPGEENKVAPPPFENMEIKTVSSNDHMGSPILKIVHELLGPPPAENSSPSSDVNDVPGRSSLNNNSTDEVTEAVASPHDPLGISCRENAISADASQPSSDPANPTRSELHHFQAEEKEEAIEDNANDYQNQIVPATDTVSTDIEEPPRKGTAESPRENSGSATPTNEENLGLKEQKNSSAETEGFVEDAPLIGSVSLENKESTRGCNIIVERDNQPESEIPDSATERSSVVRDQGGIHELNQEIDQVQSVQADGNASVGHDTDGMMERTAEEEEWLSMGLGLGDALRQILQLTEEKDSSLATCQATYQDKAQAEALFAKSQSRLETEMSLRADFESQVQQGHQTLKSYQERLASYETMEDDLRKAEANLVTLASEKSKIELEVQKLQVLKDESKQKEVVLSNRLNDAKKKEAKESTAAGRLEADNENLRDDLKLIKDELQNTQKAKAKLESNMAKLKSRAVERVKQAETALSEERELNEERKKKMKVFVETKAQELRDARGSANDTQKELEETRASLRSSRDREEGIHTDLEASRLKYRELQRNMERMKRNSDQLHLAGNSLEQELEKSANETEEHKKKRISAKHEIMQMVRLLESERSVSAKLRESVKFTFTPKALSQQELLNEALSDFQVELERLATKTGKTLLPSSESNEQDLALERADSSEINGSRKSRKRITKADMDTERLVSNLEQETQHVSKGIMALAGSIERMRSLLNEDYGCMTFFSNILAAGTGEAKHIKLGDSDDHEENNSDQFV